MMMTMVLVPDLYFAGFFSFIFLQCIPRRKLSSPFSLYLLFLKLFFSKPLHVYGRYYFDHSFWSHRNCGTFLLIKRITVIKNAQFFFLLRLAQWGIEWKGLNVPSFAGVERSRSNGSSEWSERLV